MPIFHIELFPQGNLHTIKEEWPHGSGDVMRWCVGVGVLHEPLGSRSRALA